MYFFGMGGFGFGHWSFKKCILGLKEVEIRWFKFSKYNFENFFVKYC
jgi:hypothetical protein